MHRSSLPCKGTIAGAERMLEATCFQGVLGADIILGAR
jgi:hypothetical protein